MRKPKKNEVEYLEAFIEKKWGDPVPYYSFFADMLPDGNIPAAVFMSFVFDQYCRCCKSSWKNTWSIKRISERLCLSEVQCREAVLIWENLGILEVKKSPAIIGKVYESDIFEVNLQMIIDFLDGIR